MSRGMVRMMLAVCLVPLVDSARSTASQQSSPTEVVIDGAKNPELFPEWFIWEHTFHFLGSQTTNRRIPLHQDLGISETEAAILTNEVKAFKELQEPLAKQLAEAKKAATAQGMSEDGLRTATHAVDLAYRHKILESRQRVHERLSPESLTRLRERINQLIEGTTVHLRGRTIQLFREPW